MASKQFRRCVLPCPTVLRETTHTISVLFVWEQSKLSQFSRRLTEFIASILNKEASLTF